MAPWLNPDVFHEIDCLTDYNPGDSLPALVQRLSMFRVVGDVIAIVSQACSVVFVICPPHFY